MAKKRLILKEKGKKITGLCAGLAEYFDIDVTVVRLIVIVLALTTWLFPTRAAADAACLPSAQTVPARMLVFGLHQLHGRGPAYPFVARKRGYVLQ